MPITQFVREDGPREVIVYARFRCVLWRNLNDVASTYGRPLLAGCDNDDLEPTGTPTVTETSEGTPRERPRKPRRPRPLRFRRRQLRRSQPRLRAWFAGYVKDDSMDSTSSKVYVWGTVRNDHKKGHTATDTMQFSDADCHPVGHVIDRLPS